jgi:hypothetical protein
MEGSEMKPAHDEEITKAIGQLLEAYDPKNENVNEADTGARIGMFVLEVLDVVKAEITRQHGPDDGQYIPWAVFEWLEDNYGLDYVTQAVREKAEEYETAYAPPSISHGGTQRPSEGDLKLGLFHWRRSHGRSPRR